MKLILTPITPIFVLFNMILIAKYCQGMGKKYLLVELDMSSQSKN